MKHGITFAKAGLSLMLVLVLLTACGQPKETRADIFNPNGIKVMPVTDSFGTKINVPISPKRIAVTSQLPMDYLNAVGAQISLAPKPADGASSLPPYIDQEQKDSLTLIESADGTLDPAALAAQKPDLIFTDNSDKATYEALSKIAPTAYIDPTLDWRSELYMYSTFLDRDTAARQYMNSYQQDSNNAKSKLNPVIGSDTIAAATLQDDTLQLYGSTQIGVGSVLYQDLSLHAPEGINGEAESAPFTMAQLQQLNPAYLIIATGIEGDTVEALNERMTQSSDRAAWSGLQAVQNKHVYLVDRSFFNDTPLAKTYAIQTLVDKLTSS